MTVSKVGGPKGDGFKMNGLKGNGPKNNVLLHAQLSRFGNASMEYESYYMTHILYDRLVLHALHFLVPAMIPTLA